MPKGSVPYKEGEIRGLQIAFVILAHKLFYAEQRAELAALLQQELLVDTMLDRRNHPDFTEGSLACLSSLAKDLVRESASS